jgi:hypothetical protein
MRFTTDSQGNQHAAGKHGRDDPKADRALAVFWLSVFGILGFLVAVSYTAEILSKW